MKIIQQQKMVFADDMEIIIWEEEYNIMKMWMKK